MKNSTCWQIFCSLMTFFVIYLKPLLLNHFLLPILLRCHPMCFTSPKWCWYMYQLNAYPYHKTLKFILKLTREFKTWYTQIKLHQMPNLFWFIFSKQHRHTHTKTRSERKATLYVLSCQSIGNSGFSPPFIKYYRYNDRKRLKSISC